MLADFSDLGVGVDDGIDGAYRKMLRAARKTHDQDVTGLTTGHALQRRLIVKRTLEQAFGWAAGVALLVATLNTDRFGYLNQQAGTIKRQTRNPPLVLKPRAEAGTGGGDDVVCGHFVPICAYWLLVGT